MRVAIIGGGQLARMMAMAGMEIGVSCSFLAETRENTSCVEGLGTVVRRLPGWDARAILAALGHPDVVTVERESVDVEWLRQLARHCPVYPSPEAVAATQHRLQEKDLVTSLGLATGPYRGACTPTQVADAVELLGYPVIVKSSRGGYDGRGQHALGNPEQLQRFCAEEGAGDWLVESRIDFDREVSLLGVRSVSGEVAFYPIAENQHQDGILFTSIAPALGVNKALQRRAREYLEAVMLALDYVGVIAMECFQVGGELLVNELAPRVHNSGHWTMRSEATSQFENHLRAILDMPLGSTQASSCAGIVNILGDYSRSNTLKRLPSSAALVDYNKSAAPRRKLGHVHVRGADHAELSRNLRAVQEQLYPAA